MTNKLKEKGLEQPSITVGLLPTKITAKSSLKEFNKLVEAFRKKHNATHEMSIVATVVFTVRDLS